MAQRTSWMFGGSGRTADAWKNDKPADRAHDCPWPDGTVILSSKSILFANTAPTSGFPGRALLHIVCHLLQFLNDSSLVASYTIKKLLMFSICGDMTMKIARDKMLKNTLDCDKNTKKQPYPKRTCESTNFSKMGEPAISYKWSSTDTSVSGMEIVFTQEDMDCVIM